ncbi:MAG: MaoC/PaaZ C-terminal domain-containing protein [Polyangiales bacterium]
MALDPSVIGLTGDPVASRVTPDLAILYALAVGATASELDLTYEGRGPLVLPTLAVVPAYDAVMATLGGLGVGFDKVVHGHQKVTARRPLPPSAELRTTARVAAVYDLKKMAQVVVETSSVDETGEVVCDTEWGIIVFGEGGWGGDPPPRDAGPPQRAPDHVVTEATRPEQALLYRLLGDKNPLHADPEFSLVKERFGGRPILHGLCTYGFAARAAVSALCAGDPRRLTHFAARMTKPVWPGDTLRTALWVDGDQGWFRTSVVGRDEPVLGQGRLALAPA